MRCFPRIRMTLRTVAGQSYRGIRRRIMTGCTAVMLLVVRSIYKVSVIHRLAMTAAAFRLQCYLGRVVLRRMRRKVARYAAMTLRAVACSLNRGVRRAVMANCTVVML